MQRYAVLADIHGNIWALDAVLEDASRRGIREFVDLGDTLYGPLEPRATAERLIESPLVGVLGNQDRILTEPAASPSSPTLDHVIGALAPRHREWLASRPATAVLAGEIFLCHGTPRSDTSYLLEDISELGSSPRETPAVEDDLATVDQPVVLCGHSHLPRVVRLERGRLVVNPGSVGLPAYTEDTPPHRMESGSPHARYAVLERTAAGWTVEQVAIPYDWDEAARVARRNGRDDWAAWLATGRAR